MKKYKIGERTFYVKKLVLVQTRYLMKELTSLGVSEKSEDILREHFNVTSDNMSRLLGCILTEEGKLFPKNEEEFSDLVQFLDNNVEAEILPEIMQDFLDLSQTAKTNLLSVKKNS